MKQQKNRFATYAKISEFQTRKVIRAFSDGLNIQQATADMRISERAVRSIYRKLRIRFYAALWEAPHAFMGAGNILRRSAESSPSFEHFRCSMDGAWDGQTFARCALCLQGEQDQVRVFYEHEFWREIVMKNEIVSRLISIKTGKIGNRIPDYVMVSEFFAKIHCLGERPSIYYASGLELTKMFMSGEINMDQFLRIRYYLDCHNDLFYKDMLKIIREKPL